MKRSTWLAAGILLLVLYAALAFGIYNTFTQHTLGANDFYSRWMGARALFLQNQNPYSDAVTREIQLGMYGRLARTDEDQVAFAYPLHAAYLAAPLVTLPYGVAQALWMALLVFCVVGGALALAVVNRIVLSPFALAAIVLSVLLFYPSVRGIFLGQYALVSFACVALAGLAIATGHNTTAGILLAISTAKPQPVVFLFPVILFWAWHNARRRVVWSALLALAILLGVSFVWVPSWLTDFLNALRAYSEYARVGPPLQTFFQLWLPRQIADALFFAASAALVAGMCVSVWRNRALGWSEFQPALGFVALVTTLMAGRIGSPDQVLLLILWMAWLAVWCAQRRRLLVAVCVLVLLFVPWYVFLSQLQGDREALVVTTLLPIATLGVFLLDAFARFRARRTVQS